MNTLDSLHLDHPTVIKADIEGSELAMLQGALHTIQHYRPTLIISVYHYLSDILDIPLFLAGLDQGYTFYLRHHFPRYGDIVCYAIPE